MPKRPLKILAVGKIKTPYWRDAALYYSGRIAQWRNMDEICLKDADPALPIEERIAKESKAILAALQPCDIPVCMDEYGKNMTSRQFAGFLEECSADMNKIPCFIIGGAFGFDDTVRKIARCSVALGMMTFPHELARVLLLEQIYRAECITRNIPYHH